MRYLASAGAFQEDLLIAAATGNLPPTFLRPHLLPGSRLEVEPVTLLRFGDLTLALAEHTASWVLLNDAELRLALRLDGIRLDDLDPGPDPGGPRDADSVRDFLGALYQRGLLRVDGRPGLDPDLLSEGALFQDGYLVEILVTQKCNLACRYCLAEAGPDQGHLDPDAARRAVDAAFRLPRARPLAFQLSGGEPFVNFPLFRDLVEYIEARMEETGRAVTIATQSNGAAITGDIASFVRDHRISIGISCDGPASLNDESRPTLGGQPSHAQTMRGMRLLREHGVSFGVITVLSRVNAGAPAEMVDFYADNGITGVKINPVNTVGDARDRWDQIGITGAEYADFLDGFIDRMLEREVLIGEANLREYLGHLLQRVHSYRCMRSNCGAGRSFFLIDSRGAVYPCAHSAGIPAWRLGSLGAADTDLRSIGQGHPVLDDFADRLVDRMPETEHCPWRHLCEGGCAVNAYQRAGTILAADTLCEFYERFYPRLLDRLATEPDRFQRLLDGAFGGAASVVDLDFGDRRASAPAPRAAAPASSRIEPGR